MAREKNITVSPLFSELFHLGLYKPSQGRMVRRVTFGSLAVAVGLGVWRLGESSLLFDAGQVVRYAVPLLLLAVGIWVAFRVVNMPKFADFLIAVEAELNKVSWPSKGELVRSTIVVLISILLLTFVLFAYDILWGLLLRALGVVSGG